MTVTFTPSTATIHDEASVFILGEDIRTVAFTTQKVQPGSSGGKNTEDSSFVIIITSRQHTTPIARVVLAYVTNQPGWTNNLAGAQQAVTDFLAIAGVTGAAIVPDGNYGDITVSGSGTVWTINPAVVDVTKMTSGVAAAGEVATADGVGGVAFAPAVSGGITELTGDGTAGPGFGSQVFTLASIIAAGGPTGSATQAFIGTYDAKGRLTAVSSTLITPAIGSITGLGTGVAAALAVNTGAAGAFIIFDGAAGTPSSIVLTNATGLPIAGLTGLGTGVAAALAIAVGSAGAFVTFNGAGGTPSSITLTNGVSLPLTTGVTGILPIANGGTGSATLGNHLAAIQAQGYLVPLYTNIATLTNQVLAAAFYPVAGLGPVLVDTTAFTQVRFQFAVTTASGSANTPRLILRYFTAYSATVSDYVDIGTVEVSGSLSSVGVRDTGFINLAAGAIGATTYIRVIMIGGDGAADPVTGPVQCFLR